MLQRPKVLVDGKISWGGDFTPIKSPPPTYEQRPPPYAQLENGDLRLVKLPTYEDFEEQHESDEEFPTRIPTEGVVIADVDYGILNLQHVEHVERFGTEAVADNASFFYAFVLSLCLNWVGFLAAYTYSGSTSGRCGALSGFGLSMIKMGFVMRDAATPAAAGIVNGAADEVQSQQHATAPPLFMPFVAMLLVLGGVLMFARGATLYLRYRRQLSTIFAPSSMML